ncbi:MAG: hypothetical protein FJX76_06840 [Armatimonadetes bacterium]|nr:hypothetical protein [Armatimonadota bacterium]
MTSEIRSFPQTPVTNSAPRGARPDATRCVPSDCVSLGEPTFHALPGAPQFDAMTVCPKDIRDNKEWVGEQMAAHLGQWPSLSAVVAVAPDGNGNTSVIVASRPDAVSGSKLQGAYEVIQRLSSSVSVKAAAVAHPVAYAAAQAFDAAGNCTVVRLPGQQDEAFVAKALSEGAKPNQAGQLEALVDSLPQGKRVALLVGGPSAAGKSTLIKQIKELAGDRKVVEFPGDMYFRDADDTKLPHTADGSVYWDDPQAMHFDEMAGAVASLIREGHADIPVYDFSAVRPGGWKLPNVNTSGMRTDKVTPTDMGSDDILVIDSIHATNDQVIDKLSSLDLPHASVYLDSEKAEDRLVRRMVRDYESRGRTPEKTLSDWDATTFPGEVNFIRPTITNLDPANDMFMVNKFPKDQGMSREDINHKVAEQKKYGLAPTYEAFQTPDSGLAAFARSEETRFEGILASPTATDKEKAAAQKALDQLRAARG